MDELVFAKQSIKFVSAATGHDLIILIEDTNGDVMGYTMSEMEQERLRDFLTDRL